MKPSKPINRKTFSDIVRSKMATKDCANSSVIDYIIDTANELGIDEKNAGYLVDRSLKEVVEEEAKRLNFIPNID